MNDQREVPKVGDNVSQFEFHTHRLGTQLAKSMVLYNENTKCTLSKTIHPNNKFPSQMPL